jgi:hypothetical protein
MLKQHDSLHLVLIHFLKIYRLGYSCSGSHNYYVCTDKECTTWCLTLLL